MRLCHKLSLALKPLANPTLYPLAHSLRSFTGSFAFSSHRLSLILLLGYASTFFLYTNKKLVVCKKAFHAKIRRRNVQNRISQKSKIRHNIQISFLRKVISQKSKIRHNFQIKFLREVISQKSKIRRTHKNKTLFKLYQLGTHERNYSKNSFTRKTISTSRWLLNLFFSPHSYKMKIRKISETNLSMSIFEFRAFLGFCKQMVKTTHEFEIKSTKHLLHFWVPTQNTMNAKNMSNINLAKKLKKLGSRQETVLAGVADDLTEEEKTNINLTLSKLDQLSNNIRVEEDKPPNQNTTEKPNFEASFISFKNDLRAYEESDKMDCLIFSTREYFWFKTDLYQSFNPLYYQRYITEITIFENEANRVLLFLASDRGFIYSKMREDCLQKNIIWKE